MTLETTPGRFYSPLKGKIITLQEIPDDVFSQGILGVGCGIEPESETVVAPVNGVICMIAETKHAIGISSDDGMEILIHVGIDTVLMGGDGFDVKVKEGQRIECGQKLIVFSRNKIKEAGYPTTTAFLITNSEECLTVQFKIGKDVMTLEDFGGIVK
ncbi:PTS sugar transporter subunit IIA [Anaerosacchariphilus polymeriproducens]|uniref:PTS sugar transporter subunit IIA n=1 Tax=Anaerosacchariphilus polymeriproducens TaxID=1812858 RepID=UPI00228759A9|nr:PTS glucose transporter subunit IIA [Anaerosacchariphilus polymeriproducens]